MCNLSAQRTNGFALPQWKIYTQHTVYLVYTVCSVSMFHLLLKKDHFKAIKLSLVWKHNKLQCLNRPISSLLNNITLEIQYSLVVSIVFGRYFYRFNHSYYDQTGYKILLINDTTLFWLQMFFLSNNLGRKLTQFISNISNVIPPVDLTV